MSAWRGLRGRHNISPLEWKLKDAKSISKKQQTNLIWKKTTNEDVLKLTTKRRFIRAKQSTTHRLECKKNGQLNIKEGDKW